MHLDGSNAENKISLLVILCIIMYVKKKKKIFKTDIFFFTKPIMVNCLNIGKNIGQPIYRSISSFDGVEWICCVLMVLSGCAVF